nr:hypothetical protein [Streptomyces albus]
MLFLAFAFFAFAQAAAVRNGGQTAADAAAVSAAKDDRDLLYEGFLDSLEDGDTWRDWLDAVAPLSGDGCGEAARFAHLNRSDLLDCEPVTREGGTGYRVGIETRFDTGDTFVPGADHKTARADATAVIRPRCEVEEAEEADGDRDGELQLTCDGEELTVDPDDEDPDVAPSDLFSVVLVE